MCAQGEDDPILPDFFDSSPLDDTVHREKSLFPGPLIQNDGVGLLSLSYSGTLERECEGGSRDPFNLSWQPRSAPGPNKNIVPDNGVKMPQWLGF